MQESSRPRPRSRPESVRLLERIVDSLAAQTTALPTKSSSRLSSDIASSRPHEESSTRTFDPGEATLGRLAAPLGAVHVPPRGERQIVARRPAHVVDE